MSVLVFIDTKGKISKAAKEAVTYGSKIGATTVVTFGDADAAALASLGDNGATKILVCRSLSEGNDQQLTKLIAAAANDCGADVIIVSQDQLGKAVAPRVAANLEAGHVSGAIALPDTSNGFVVKTNVFSGKAFANVSVNSSKKVISLLPNSLPPESTGGSAEVAEFNCQ